MAMRIRGRRRLATWSAPAAALAAAACGSSPPPLPLVFAGLPVSGGIELARQAGFRHCFNTDAVAMRCRRHGVTLLGGGPYEAAVDLAGGYGESGFRELTLWSEADNDAVYEVIVELTKRGWRYCYTGGDQWGDQAVFTHGGERVKIAMDISYWGRRRLRVLPIASRVGLDQPCTPDTDLMRFGPEVAKAARS